MHFILAVKKYSVIDMYLSMLCVCFIYIFLCSITFLHVEAIVPGGPNVKNLIRGVSLSFFS